MVTSQESGPAVTAHTPGPWRAFKAGPNPWWIVQYGGGTPRGGRDVADVESGEVAVWNDRKRPEAVQANAHLIAAAPDLLALAKQYLSECSGCDGTGIMPVCCGHGNVQTDSRGESVGLACCGNVTPTPCVDCADIRQIIDKAEGRA